MLIEMESLFSIFIRVYINMMQLAVLAGDFLLFRALGSLASLENTEVRVYIYIRVGH